MGFSGNDWWWQVTDPQGLFPDLDYSDPDLSPPGSISDADFDALYAQYLLDLAAYEEGLSQTAIPTILYAHGCLEYMQEVSFPGPCSMVHLTVSKMCGGNFIRDGYEYRTERFPWGFLLVTSWQEDPDPPIGLNDAPLYDVPFIWKIVQDVISKHQDDLNWSSLPSSTEFGLIQFIAELDDTIGQFSIGFVKKLFSLKDGWGSFEWGILPLVSDITGLIDAYKKRNIDMNHFPIESQYTARSNDFGSHVLISEILIRHTGYASSLADPYLEFLDRIGLKFDISIVWDLIPLSFVIDYLLPIGDLLGTLSNGGWVRSVEFEGWTTMSYSITYDNDHLSLTGATSIDSSTSANVFYRRFNQNVLTVPYFDSSDGDIEMFSLPSLRQLWNMVYIFLS
jgi:hypothetical protein